MEKQDTQRSRACRSIANVFDSVMAGQVRDGAQARGLHVFFTGGPFLMQPCAVIRCCGKERRAVAASSVEEWHGAGDMRIYVRPFSRPRKRPDRESGRRYRKACVEKAQRRREAVRDHTDRRLDDASGRGRRPCADRLRISPRRNGLFPGHAERKDMFSLFRS